MNTIDFLIQMHQINKACTTPKDLTPAINDLCRRGKYTKKVLKEHINGIIEFGYFNNKNELVHESFEVKGQLKMYEEEMNGDYDDGYVFGMEDYEEYGQEKESEIQAYNQEY